MTIARVTFSTPAATLRKIKRAAGKRGVSAWLTEMVEERLGEQELERLWESFCKDVTPTAAETRRADAIFTRGTRARRRRAA